MVTCEYCELEMLECDSCTFKFETLNGRIYRRTCGYDGSRCRDCGIIRKEGNAHHPMCDSEYCPVCGGQAFACDCKHGPMYTAVPAGRAVSPPVSDRVDI